MEEFILYAPKNIEWFYIVMVLAMLALCGSFVLQRRKKVWSRTLKIVTYPITVISVLIMSWGCLHIYQQSHATLSVSYGDYLRVHAGIGSPDITWGQMDIENIRISNPYQEDGLRPVGRTFGTGMKGFSAGWFRLENGQSAFLSYVGYVDADQTLIIPVREEGEDSTSTYLVMLHVQDEEKLLQLLTR